MQALMYVYGSMHVCMHVRMEALCIYLLLGYGKGCKQVLYELEIFILILGKF